MEKVTLVNTPLLALLAFLALATPLSAGEDTFVRWRHIDGMAVRYSDTGAPEGAPEGEEAPPTIIFVHGYCGAAANFLPLFPFLAPSARCVAVDLPGCAGSAKPGLDYDVPFFVGFLESFRRRLGLESFVLVGHSMGGQIAAHYTRRFPETVQKLVLVAPDGLAGEEGGWRVIARLDPLIEAGLALTNRSFVTIALRTIIFHDPALVNPDLVDCFAEGLLTPEGAHATALIAHGIIGHDPVDEVLPHIAHETLVIWGKNDRLLSPSWAPRYIELLPRAELRMLPGCGHAPMLEKPEQTAALIAEFLGR
jgi:pimeloyl-ACP methyl ester carboxylesterase